MYALNNDDPRMIEVSTKHDHWNLEMVRPWSLVGVSNNALLLENGGKLVVQFADARNDYVVTAQPIIQHKTEQRFDLFNISDQRILCYTRWHDKYALYDRASKKSVMIQGASMRMSERGDLWSIGKKEYSGVMPVSPHRITIPYGCELRDWSVWHGHAAIMCYQKDTNKGRSTIIVKDIHDRVISRIWLKEAPLKIMTCQQGVILAYWDYKRYVLDTYTWVLQKTGSDPYLGIGYPFTTSVVKAGAYKRLAKVSHRHGGAWK